MVGSCGKAWVKRFSLGWVARLTGSKQIRIFYWISKKVKFLWVPKLFASEWTEWKYAVLTCEHIESSPTRPGAKLVIVSRVFPESGCDNTSPHTYRIYKFILYRSPKVERWRRQNAHISIRVDPAPVSANSISDEEPETLPYWCDA